MSEIYWITRLDSIKFLFEGVAVISALGIIGYAIAWLIAKAEDFDLPLQADRCAKVVTVTLGFSISILAFVPSSKEAMAIIGIGGTIEYLKDNEAARKLPEKALKALDMYFDECIKTTHGDEDND